MIPMSTLTPQQRTREIGLLAGAFSLLLLACFGPAIAQSTQHHHFADHSLLWGVPHAMDVLSNLPFALWALAGFWALAVGLPAAPTMVSRAARTVFPAALDRSCAALFFAGLAFTAVGSSWYHLRPDDAGLVVDRLGMVLAFAGLLGLAVADRISTRAGPFTALAVMLAGPVSVAVWAHTGNVLPWAAVQFGGMALVMVLALLKPPHGHKGLALGAVVAIYAVAKLFELADHPIHDLTAHTVSGHTLKHLVAGCAAWPVLQALRADTPTVQNSAQTNNTKAVA